MFIGKNILKKILLIPVILPFFILTDPLLGGEQLLFSWSFILKSADGNIRSLEFEGPERVSEGELLRIYLEAYGGVFVYLYLFDSRRDLYLVFPPSGNFYNGDTEDGYQSFIPSGRRWLALDDLNGTERFYLFASGKRLVELERLTDRYLVGKERDLKMQLLDRLEGQSARFSAGFQYEIERGAIQPGEWPGLDEKLSRVEAQKVVADGGYGVVLELIGR